VRILEAGGQWTEDLPEHVVLGIGWALLGEVLKERAASDEVVFGDPEVFRDLLTQSRAAFARAAELDPSDNTSFMNALELAEERADDSLDELDGVLRDPMAEALSDAGGDRSEDGDPEDGGHSEG
jgi:hypothetical protein